MKAAIIGGDKRMLYAAKAFLDDGAEVAIAGFDHLQSLCDIRTASIAEAAEWADFSVLPIRPILDGKLNCPYAKTTITADDFASYFGSKPIFCGNAAILSAYTDAPLYDYAAREEFAVQNAILTAEGAIELILRCYEGSVYGTDILILGYGRIGRALSHRLSALGAKVTVAARKLSDRAWIESERMLAVDYSFKELNKYQIIINTVPAPVLKAAEIDRLHETAFLIDLASAPGGMDSERIRQRDLTYIHALGLPGKTAPKAAGRIIKDTVINIIKEENGGKENLRLCNDGLLLHL